MNEKRQHGERVQSFIDLSVEENGISNIFRAAASDISAGGMRLISPQPLPAGAKYIFTFKHAPHLVLHGEVRWVEQVGNRNYNAGVRFTHNAPDTNTTLGAFVEAERARPTAR